MLKRSSTRRCNHIHQTRPTADLSNGRMKHRFASSSVGAQSQRSRRALRSLHTGKREHNYQ